MLQRLDRLEASLAGAVAMGSDEGVLDGDLESGELNELFCEELEPELFEELGVELNLLALIKELVELFDEGLFGGGLDPADDLDECELDELDE
jgi:hypothetical protein